MLNKRGKKGTILLESIIFIVLNLIFLSAVFAYAKTRTSDFSFYSEVYAKQIVLLLDSAKPGIEILLDVSTLDKKFPNNKITINHLKNEVNITGSKGAFIQPFFSNNSVEYSVVNGKLKLTVFSPEPTIIENQNT